MVRNRSMACVLVMVSTCHLSGCSEPALQKSADSTSVVHRTYDLSGASQTIADVLLELERQGMPVSDSVIPEGVGARGGSLEITSGNYWSTLKSVCEAYDLQIHQFTDEGYQLADKSMEGDWFYKLDHAAIASDELLVCVSRAGSENRLMAFPVPDSIHYQVFLTDLTLEQGDQIYDLDGGLVRWRHPILVKQKWTTGQSRLSGKAYYLAITAIHNVSMAKGVVKEIPNVGTFKSEGFELVDSAARGWFSGRQGVSGKVGFSGAQFPLWTAELQRDESFHIPLSMLDTIHMRSELTQRDWDWLVGHTRNKPAVFQASAPTNENQTRFFLNTYLQPSQGNDMRVSVVGRPMGNTEQAPNAWFCTAEARVVSFTIEL